jgi:hypothetical protein
MILANLRERISAADVDLVVRLLAQDDPDRGETPWNGAGAERLDRLLDHPALPALLERAPAFGRPSAALFVYVMVRRHLSDAGVDDRALADYVGAVVFDFGFRDRAWRVSRHDDETYRYVVDIRADVGAVAGRRGLLLRAHLGNYSLWLAGIFPEFITARRERAGGPGLAYYDTAGETGFRMAAEHELARELGLADLYGRAADSFQILRAALNRMSGRVAFSRGTSSLH